MDNIAILPHDILAEQAVLGAIFIDPDKIVLVAEHLKPEDFYRPGHQIIFRTMQTMCDKGQAIDAVTMKTALEDQGDLSGIGGLAYIAEIVNSVPTSANAEFYAKTVAEKALMRKVIANLSDTVAGAYSGEMSANDLIARAEQALVNASNSSHNTGFKAIYDVILDNHSKIEQRSNFSSDVTGIATGFTDFDKLTTGLHEDQLIILAARPAMGKSAFAINIAQNVACKSNKPVAIFSLEMSADSLVERMLAAEGTIKSYHIRTGKLTQIEWQRLIYAQGQLAEAPIYIDDTAGIRITEIRSRARKLAQSTGGLGLIVIDYLQLIQGSRSDNRQQEVSEISRQLKIIAKELKVPVIALSQLSRSVERFRAVLFRMVPKRP